MSLIAAPLSNRLLPAVGKLIRLRLRITVNSFKHAKTVRKILIVMAYLGLLVFAGLIFFLSWLLLGFLRSPQLVQYVGLDPAPFLQAVPVLIFTGLFLGILLSSFGVLLQALYLSGDMDFLLSSPVPIRAVFVTKLLQAVLPNFGLIALFGLPVLFGLGISGHYNLLYYPLVLLVMAALALAAAGISALLVMLAARVFPARRVAEVIGFIGATLTIVCSQLGNLTQTFGHNRDISADQVSGMFSTLTRLNSPWLPLNWAGRGLVELGEGRWLSGSLLLVLTLGLSAVAFWFALATAERWYYTGWAGMQVIARKKKAHRIARAGTSTVLGAGTSAALGAGTSTVLGAGTSTVLGAGTSAALGAGTSAALGAGAYSRTLRQISETRGRAASRVEQLFPAPVRAIVRKDFLMLRRDLRNLSQLISPLIFGVIYSVMLFRTGELPAGQGQAPAWLMNSLHILITYGSVGMSLFVGWSLLGRLAGMGFSQEGKNYWMLKSSPVRSAHLLAAKYLVAYLPALALGWFFLICIAIFQKIPLAGFLYNLLTVALCLAGMNGILLAFGVVGANFNWEDPRRMNAGAMGCLGALLTAVFMLVAFGLFIGPLLVISAVNLPLLFGYLAGFILGSLICGAAAVLPIWLVRGKVARMGEV